MLVEVKNYGKFDCHKIDTNEYNKRVKTMKLYEKRKEKKES